MKIAARTQPLDFRNEAERHHRVEALLDPCTLNSALLSGTTSNFDCSASRR